MHGEEGLSDDFQGGRRYESWKFYQEEFGNQFSLFWHMFDQLYARKAHTYLEGGPGSGPAPTTRFSRSWVLKR